MSKKFNKNWNWFGRWYYRIAMFLVWGGCLLGVFYIGLWIYTVYVVGEEFDFF